MINHQNITELVIHQLINYWPEINKTRIEICTHSAVEDIVCGFKCLASTRFNNNGIITLDPMHSVSWSIFLYKLSRRLYQKEYLLEADAVYYLNKIMHSVDWYYQIELPVHFMAEHPLGSVLGKAKYGDYFFVYQGTTVGGSRKKGILSYPRIGKNVILYANATVLGETQIGDNVVVSANSYLINETIPDNSIVFGSSPEIVIKRRSQSEIMSMTSHIWKTNL